MGRAFTLKEHRAEIKLWKKDLGEARSKIIKLEKNALQTDDREKIRSDCSKVKSKKRATKKIEIKDDSSLTQCSICSLNIFKYIPEYFCGEKFNPACDSCKANDSSWNPDDPFASYPSPSQPSSMVSHWISVDVNTTPQRPGSTLSMIPHYAILPDPGSYLISKEEVLEMMREIFKKWI